MTTQITIRLDDDAVAFIDRQVSKGRDKSRASVVARAIRRAQRDERAAKDVEILASMPEDEDMNAFVTWAAKHPVALD